MQRPSSLNTEASTVVEGWALMRPAHRVRAFAAAKLLAPSRGARLEHLLWPFSIDGWPICGPKFRPVVTNYMVKPSQTSYAYRPHRSGQVAAGCNRRDVRNGVGTWRSATRGSRA